MNVNGDTKIFIISDRKGNSIREIYDVDNVAFDSNNKVFTVQTIYRSRYFIPCVEDETYFTNAFIVNGGRKYV